MSHDKVLMKEIRMKISPGSVTIEPRDDKTCLRGLRQVRLKPVCSAKEAS